MRTGIASTLFVSLAATAWGAGPSIASVTNGASLTSGPIAPGELIIISGSGFGAGSSSSSGSPLPTTLANVTVTLGSTKLGLLSVSPSQINAVVPGDLAPNANYQIVVQSGSTLSAPYQVTVAATALGVFTADSSGHGQALAFAVDGTANSSASPAAPGSVLEVYFTGGGLTNSSGSIVQNVVVGVNNSGVAVLYAGLAPSLPGYYQANIQISPGTSGVVPILIGISTSSGVVFSQGGVTIATGTGALSPSATLSVLPTSLTFTTGGTAPPPQTISVSSSGSPISFTASSSTDTGVNWLSIQNSTGTTPATVNVTVNPAGLPPNNYTGTVAFTYSGGEVDVPVTLTVQQQPTAPSVNSSIITTFAGTNFTFPSSPLPALNAPLGSPQGLATDSAGNVYVADRANNMVMRISPSGSLSAVAGNGVEAFSGDGGPATSASLAGPFSVAVDPSGNLYIADFVNVRVRKVSTNGIITTIAGNGTFVAAPDGAPATQTGFEGPQSVAVDSAGNVLVADDGVVRKISPTGIITTAATLFPPGGFGEPIISLAANAAGNVYIYDGSCNCIHLLTPSGSLTTVAGSTGFDDVLGIAVDAAGNLYVSEGGGNDVRKLTPGGTQTVVAGTGFPGYSGDGGPAGAAQLSFPYGLATDTKGNLYICDQGNERIRKVTSGGTISTIAGNGLFRFSGDGGPATSAVLSDQSPTAITTDTSGNIYIVDGARVRKISPKGIINTVAGDGVSGFLGDGGPAINAEFSGISGLSVDSVGNLFIADNGNGRIRKVTPNGIVNTIAGNGTEMHTGDGGPALNAGILYPQGVTVDAAGDLYIPELYQVRKVSPNGTISTFAGTSQQGSSGDGGPATSAELGGPRQVAVDSNGNVFIADTFSNLIRKVSPSGIISTYAGMRSQSGFGSFSGDGGLATSAMLNGPYSIALDSAGDLYIADTENNRVRIVMPDGIINTFAGSPGNGYFGDGGPATEAGLYVPEGVAVDPSGNVFIADTFNSRVREVSASAVSFQASPTSLTFSAALGANASASQSINVSSSIAGLSFSLAVATSSGGSWLSVSPASGSTPSVLQVTVNPSGLSSGTYQGSITITAPNASPSSQTVAVSFTISGGTPSQLAVSTTSIPFSLAQGANPATAQFTISNTGSGSTRYAVSVTSVNNLLQASATHGSVTAASPVNVTVTATPGTLGPGTYTGTIVITGPDTGQTLTVTVIVAITAAPPTILLSQLGFTFTAVSQGGTVLPQTLGILNSGAGTLTYSVQATTQSGGSGWLSVSSNSGTVNRPLLDVSFIDVSVNANQLPPPGTYYGQIVVSATGAGNSPQTALVVLNVLTPGSNPGPDVRPTGLVFIGVAGAENPGSQTVTVANVTGTPTNIAAIVASPTVKGLIASQPTNFTVPSDAPQSIVVQPNFSSLAAGQYRAGMLVYPDEGPSQTVNILAVVAPAGTPAGDVADRDRPRASSACTPTKLLPQFTAAGFNLNLTVGYPAFVAATVVDDCTVPMTTGSVTLSFTNGDPPISLISTQDGNWTNSWQPGHPSASVGLTLTATSGNFTGTAVESPGAVQQGSQTPPLLSGAPLGAVTLSAGPFAPGDLMLLKGTGLADGQESSSSTALKNQLAGAQVAIGQAGLISLLYADANQVVGLVPSNLQPNSSQAVIVQRDSALGVQVPVIISTTHPAILTVNGSGQGQGSVYKSNGAATTLANSANPANTGDSIIVYCTGLGVTNADGSAANIPMLTIGGATAPISYAGVALPASYPSTGAPMLLGLVSSSLGGLYQITATVPAGVATGAAAVTITSAGQTSQSGVTMIVGGQGSATPPSITPGGVVNAASYAALPVSPGALVAIFTSALAAQPASFSTASLPPSLGGVSVSFNGVTAPMVGVSPSGAYPFISAQVPFEVLAAGQTSTTVPVVVTVNGVPSAAVQTPIVASSPGIFTIPPTGQGNAVLVNLSDYSIAAPTGSIPGLTAHPIARGQTAFFYVTGLGAMTPSVADGSGTCPASNGLCNANALPTVLVGGVPATASAVQAPGFPGVVQINIAIPQTAPTGSAVSLIVKSKDGTVTSNTATIAVQ